MQASLFNLILYTQKNKRADYIHSLMQKVIERFPSRVIFITVDKSSSQDEIKTSVSTIQGGPDVTCDLLTFETTGKTESRIPYLILPHITPDLPVYLLWAENPIQDNPLSHQLDTLATRMIFDSESTDDLSKFAKALLQHQKESGCDIADLNWARTENWRNLLSATFYSDERLKQLQRAKKIQITYNAHETKFFCHTKIQAIYIQGWLASQLGWKLSSIKEDTLTYGPITVELLSSKDPDLPPGTIISMSLLTDAGEHFSFSRSSDHPQQVSMILCTPEKCEIPCTYIFTKSHSGLSLVNEIGFTGTSEHYLNLLSYLLTWGI